MNRSSRNNEGSTKKCKDNPKDLEISLKEALMEMMEEENINNIDSTTLLS